LKPLTRFVNTGILSLPIISLATLSALDVRQIQQQIKPQLNKIEPKKLILIPDEDDGIKLKDVS
jgi:hypothetical protein